MWSLLRLSVIEVHFHIRPASTWIANPWPMASFIMDYDYAILIQMRPEPRKEFVGLPGTVHGGQGWKLADIEDYSQNLNPLGPPPGLSDSIAGAIGSTGHYPDADCTGLREKIGRMYGLEAENVTMGAGSSEIIRDFPNVFVRPGGSVLIPSPSFAEYAQQCRIAGAYVDRLDLRPENDFRIDPDELFLRLSSKRYDALYICNPNNPTGRVEGRDKLFNIVRRCGELGAMVFLDETLLALVDGGEGDSLSREVGKFDNLIVLHSFTKSFAVPGLRVGFALSNPEVIEQLEKAKLPWNIGTLEQAAADYFLTIPEYVSEAAGMMHRESVSVNANLREAGFPIGDVSDSFFYFVDLEGLSLTGKEFQDLMLKEGIMVRDCSSFGPRFRNYVRFCVKDRERDDRFVKAVRNVMASIE